MLMKRAYKLLSLFVIFVMTIFVFSSITEPANTYNIVANQYLYSTETLENAEAIAEEYNLELLSYSDYGIAIYNSDVKNDSFLIDNGFVYNSYSNIEGPPWSQTTDEDPYLDNQYGLVITNTIDAWETTTGLDGLTIAIIDTGIDINHPEFEGRISPLSKNVATGSVGLPAVDDDYGHGTMVAGIIGANKDNSIGIAGITQNTTLLIIKANQSYLGTFLDSNVIEGIYYAIEQGADIINLSLGSSYPNPQTEEAINLATEAGIIVVGASGNDGTDELLYPASFDNSISVGAVDESYTVADYSNYNDQVDISGPGTDIITTSIDGGYVQGSGTSFAAPHVTGIIALYLSIYPNASIEEIKTKLFISSLDLGEESLDPYYGYGLINANNFINSTYYKITYITDPGSEIESDYIIAGSFLETTETPVLIDEIFVGWYLNPELTVAFDNSIPITSDLTLYAKYSDAFHNVRFITAGSNVSDLIVEHDSYISLPYTSLDGFNFIGWYLDSNYQTEYVQAPVTSDITLYAKFEEIIYYDINYYVLDSLYQKVTLEADTLVNPIDLNIYGYSFNGWYLDDQFLIEYNPYNILEDIDLYALLEPDIFNITLNIDGASSVLSFEYLEVPEINDPSKTDFDFAGWYLDDDYTIRYFSEPITEDITLYANFLSQIYTVDLVILGVHYDYIYVIPDTIPELPEININGYDFQGWYLDDQFSVEYSSNILNNNLILYGQYTETLYTIRFFDAYGSIISTQSLTYNENIVFPESPEKTSTISFDFEFSAWSTNALKVIENIDIYPVYNKSFIESSVYLLPAVDTIFVGENHEDGSIYMADTSLTISIDSKLDNSTPGRYEIIYNIYDEETIVYSISRYVRVVENPVQIEIVLNPGISTLYQGELYVETGAISNLGDVTISGSVNTSLPGIYYILYEVEYNGAIYSKTRIVNVLDNSQLIIIVESLSINKEEEYE